jgi:outer membrane protein assembly factor BamA
MHSCTPPGLFLFALVTISVGAEESCEPAIDPATRSYEFTARNLASNQLAAVPIMARIGDVHVSSLPVFDEDNVRENNALYRFANRYHINTRAMRVKRQLLFASGDAYDARAIEESARLLRAEKYLYDADIRPVRVCNNQVDLEVITRDVWSFTPELSYSRAGGEGKYRLGVRETNLFGMGTELAFRIKHSFERDEKEFIYRDDNISGSRIASRVRISDNDDGFENALRVGMPFFSLDSRRSWHGTFSSIERVESQYLLGESISEVEHRIDDAQLRYGWSRGLRDGVTSRWTAGYAYQKSEFAPTSEKLPPAVFPYDTTLSYPFIEYVRIQDRFTTSTNLNQIHRTEDLYLGRNLRASLGYAAEALGSNQNRLVFSGSFNDTLAYNGDYWLSHQLLWNGRYNLETESSEQVRIDYLVRYFRRQTKHRSFFFNFQATYTRHLNSHQQVFYGGESGARAFDNRFQTGDRRVSLSLEERMYTDIHLFNLVRVGWAIFIDVGRAWQPGVDSGLPDDYLANMGLGLRFTSSKAQVGRVLHVDLSFPMTNKDDPNVESSQVSVSLKNRF